MTGRWTRYAGLLFLVVTLLACKMLKGQKSYEGNVAGLTQLATDLSNAKKSDAQDMGKALALPDPTAYFSATFGPDLGGQLATEYASEAAKLPSVQAFFILNKLKGRTQILVEEHTTADDPNANGLQDAAMRKMTKPTVLYTVNVVEPGKTIGASLWSFAYVDGHFRYLGKLKATKPGASPLDELSKKDLQDALEGK
ncbi:MAG: hypothetical protein KC776_19435 [Myxococcales bacterium]|nr:hypothetical protein [Myxococcales bacterium]MCB9576149.1 hypothetical protein [Polyangiaceae bacterium]